MYSVIVYYTRFNSEGADDSFSAGTLDQAKRWAKDTLKRAAQSRAYATIHSQDHSTNLISCRNRRGAISFHQPA